MWGGGTVTPRPRMQQLSDVVGPVYINLHHECELPCSNDFRYKQRVEINGGAVCRLYHLAGNVISAAVGLVYINLEPEYALPSSTRFGQFQKFGKI